MNKLFILIIIIFLFTVSGCAFLSNMFGIEVSGSSNNNKRNNENVTNSNNVTNIDDKKQYTAEPINDIMVFDAYTYIIDKTGSVYSWYADGYAPSESMLGRENNYIYAISEALSKKVNISQPITQLLVIANKVYAISKDKTYYAFTNKRENCDPIKIDILEPIKQLYQFDDENGGSRRNYAITKNGSLYSWGKNDGFLGIGSYEDVDIPTKVNIAEPVKDVVSIKFRDEFSDDISMYAITNHGSIYVWGWNNSSQLGLGDRTNRITPQKVNIYESVKDIYFDDDYVYAVTNNGYFYMWGIVRGNFGKTVGYDSPEKIENISENIEKFGITNNYDKIAYAITKKGSLYLWIPDKTDIKKVNIPYPVKDILIPEDDSGDYIAITNNGFNYEIFLYQNEFIIKQLTNIKEPIKSHSPYYAITNNGTLYMRGPNGTGWLGVGDYKDRNDFIKVKIPESIKDITINNGSVYAITKSDSIYVWGGNSRGELGLGSYEHVNTPTKVNITEPVKKIVSCGVVPAYALTINGELYNWYNDEKLPEKLKF